MKDLDAYDYEQSGERDREFVDPVVAMNATEAIVTIVGSESHIDEHGDTVTYPVTQVHRLEFDTPEALSEWLDTSNEDRLLASQSLNEGPRWKSCGHVEDATDARYCDEPTCKNFLGKDRHRA
jgi:hypothetical protein